MARKVVTDPDVKDLDVKDLMAAREAIGAAREAIGAAIERRRQRVIRAARICSYEFRDMLNYPEGVELWEALVDAGCPPMSERRLG